MTEKHAARSATSWALPNCRWRRWEFVFKGTPINAELVKDLAARSSSISVTWC